MNKIKVAVIGASGYAGLELVRLLVRHPGCDLAALTSLEYPGIPFSQVFPALAGIVDLSFSPASGSEPEKIAAGAEVVFTAIPHQAAMGIIPRLLAKKGCKVVDLSADFRFREVGLYEKWYQAHTAPELLTEAVYGLPELHREEVRRTRLVANPGCYPTCVILGLAPLAQARLLQPDSVIADCKSGVSGAGRQTLLGLTFCEVNDGFRAYKVLEHRHTPEMEQELSRLAGTPVQVTFTPHLVPMSRGILGTLYASLTEPRAEGELRELYRKFYQGHPFVRLHPPGSLPDTRNVRGANFCDLALRVDEGGRRVIVLSAIDNLAKGAASQAVQNFNLMVGFPETMGLETPPFLP
ncbi:MAG: N-acetyl-gamma-glutamyl-phosphate reductase [Deltaproteobacteria bacterium]|nr:N-acetyl-gamma-glutamyl-phosphate reductase [Deltaproteobacteria bacterium]